MIIGDDMNDDSVNNKSNNSNNNDTNNTNTNNTNSNTNTNNNNYNINSNNHNENKEEESKYSESKPSEKILKRKMNDEDFINFERDLKDYLRRTISTKRQKVFFNSILPESLEVVQKLFVKNNNLSTNIAYPIYRNDYLELSLTIEQGGKIKKKILYLKI